MRRIGSFAALETLGRTRLSRHFFLRDFLMSEIANFHGMPNIPDDPDLAITAGRALCQTLLDPLVNTFGPLTIRSSFRSASVNAFGNEHGLNCARNPANHAGHIWDRRDDAGFMGATACLSVPWFADQYDRGRDWRDLAWWIHDHLPYSEMWFFPKRAALNLTWHERPRRKISSYIAPKGTLLAAGAEPDEQRALRRARYGDFPPLCGIAYPPLPKRFSGAAQPDQP